MTNNTDLFVGLDEETLVSIVVRKKGVQKGPKGSKKTYGDDLVHVLIWAGWDYLNLVRLSLEYLGKIDKTGRSIATLMAMARSDGHDGMTVEAACVAVQEVRESLWFSLEKRKKGSSSSSLREQWYKPVLYKGKPLRGVKRYVGHDRSVQGAPSFTPIPGTTYIHGLKLGEMVLEKSPNGDWVPDSSLKTIAKDYMKRRLPVGRYVSYALPPDQTFQVKVGVDAILAVRESGVDIDAAAILALFKIAQSVQEEPVEGRNPLPEGIEPIF